MKVEAIYEKGVFRPIQKVDLEDGKIVEISFESLRKGDSAFDFSDIAVDMGITDLAVNIDHCLYGLPKQG